MLLFFFKQKTAYEMRISDWSSDVCSSDLKSESFAELDKVIEFMKQNPAVVIELSGHTDNVGSPESNQVLSENRAKAVYAYLIRAILKPDRFRFKGYGESRPLASNTTKEGDRKSVGRGKSVAVRVEL